MENLVVVKPNVFHQAHLLGQERERIQCVATHLRSNIDDVVQAWPDVPTAGIVCNLKSIVDAWEENQVQQIADQVNEL